MICLFAGVIYIIIGLDMAHVHPQPPTPHILTNLYFSEPVGWPEFEMGPYGSFHNIFY